MKEKSGEVLCVNPVQTNLASTYSLPNNNRIQKHLSTISECERSTCSSALDANGLPLKPVRELMAVCLVKVQKMIRIPNVRVATSPVLVFSGC